MVIAVVTRMYKVRKNFFTDSPCETVEMRERERERNVRLAVKW